MNVENSGEIERPGLLGKFNHVLDSSVRKESEVDKSINTKYSTKMFPYQLPK